MLKTIPIEASFFTQTRGTQVAWLGMAGALINTRGAVLLIDPLIALKDDSDPWVNEIGYRLSVPLPIQAREIPRADLVMYTHADDDHFGPRTARTLSDQLGCRFLAPPPVAERLVEAGVPRAQITIARDNAVLSVGQAAVTVTPALHDWQEVNPWQRGDCCGYLIRTPDGAIWHPGDTRLIDDLRAFNGVDVLFFDVAAVDSHLGPAGSAELAKSCGASVLLAYHYGTFDMPPGTFATCDPEDALPYLEGLRVRYLRVNPGELLNLPVG